MSEAIKFPKLRPLQLHQLNYQGQPGFLMRDPQGYCQKEAFVPLQLCRILGLFDGNHSLLDIQAEYMRRFGEFLYSENLEQFIHELDEGLFLESERFRAQKVRLEEEFRRSPVRPPALAGRSYPDEPERLSQLLDGLFSGPDGPGPPKPSASHDRIRGVVAPHVDLQRGGLTFARAYKELAEGSEAELFIVLGTAHAPTEGLFILTRKDFETPLGLLKTDREVVERLEIACGKGLFEEEYAHKAEHSIELQALFIAHLFAKRRPVSFVPILCGSFQEFILNGKLPGESPDVATFTHALKEALAEGGRKNCIVASADLAHVGPQFGDPFPVDRDLLRLIEAEDMAAIRAVERVDTEGFFRSIQSDGDKRKVCGLSAIYTLLSIIDAREGRLIDYRQWPDPDGTVSFAALSFYA